MKRLNLRLMLVLLLGFVLVLAACAPEPTPTATPEPEPTEEATEEPVEETVEPTEEATEEPVEETVEPTEEADMGDMDMEATEEADMDMEGGMDHGMMGGSISAVYATITNDGEEDITLIRAETDAAAIVEIHETTVEDDVARMQELEDGLVIPAGETVMLEPGGYHVMLIDLQRDLITGRDVDVDFVFEMSGGERMNVSVNAEIQDVPLEEGQQPVVADDLQIELVWARPGAGMAGDGDDMGSMEEEEPSDGPTTVVDVALAATEADAPEFTTLVAALEAADLVDALAGDGPFTVFAPTDEAFAAALEALEMDADELLSDTELLQSILTYHVAQGEFMEADVLELDGETVEMLSGFTVEISVTDDGVVLNDSVNVITTNIAADNGVIHVIDGVLLPPE